MPGHGVPDVGDSIGGVRNSWTVLEVQPVESRRYPNAWRGRLLPHGPHGLTPAQVDRRFRWVYPPVRSK